ncbi:hypothetical protein [Foetidibacter luteolus]|uniref:hypothetical protein n=1 Tax=Foetidibacter luteolus TaxID=2608880 RepID=UPI00129C0DA0|nr:hypothetical protein [Foetidibacter luteolus]
MKKLFITSALFLSLIGSVLASGNNLSGFNGAGAFKKAFPDATDVSVKSVDQLTKISFTSNSQSMEVFYSREGEMIAKSRHIKLNELPAGASENIGKKYSDWTITEAIEFLNAEDGTTHYYVGVSINNKSMILEADKDGELSIYKK